MSWPVPGTLMIEPTESESKVCHNREDLFVQILLSLTKFTTFAGRVGQVL